MTLDPIEIWHHMSGLNKAIAVILITMGVSTIGVVVERILAFSKANSESRTFVQKAAALLDEWRIDELISLTEKHKSSTLARTIGAMMQRYQRGLERAEKGLTLWKWHATRPNAPRRRLAPSCDGASPS